MVSKSAKILPFKNKKNPELMVAREKDRHEEKQPLKVGFR